MGSTMSPRFSNYDLIDKIMLSVVKNMVKFDYMKMLLLRRAGVEPATYG